MTRVSQVGLTLLILCVATPALGGFGFQLGAWEGEPGEVVQVEGSGLLTCCPANTPAVAELLLEVDPRRPSTRVVLFTGVVADASGGFVASFMVPDLPGGTYELEYCARNPETSDQASQRICVPAERNFLVLSAGPSWFWGVGAVLLVAGVVVGLIARSRRRRGAFQT
ncbi:MAG: hypothetical protein ACR2NT_10225 [Acidimicrobiia bacterium]|nr:hypothetical protein [Acidimicrobiia bacterium]